MLIILYPLPKVILINLNFQNYFLKEDFKIIFTHFLSVIIIPTFIHHSQIIIIILLIENQTKYISLLSFELFHKIKSIIIQIFYFLKNRKNINIFKNFCSILETIDFQYILLLIKQLLIYLKILLLSTFLN